MSAKKITMVHPSGSPVRDVASEAEAVKLEWSGYVRQENSDAARPAPSDPAPSDPARSAKSK